jgi:hypothetical protein
MQWFKIASKMLPFIFFNMLRLHSQVVISHKVKITVELLKFVVFLWDHSMEWNEIKLDVTSY